ncbi:hypothetical protein NKH77_06950 [Streptomyces sp. M19]
MGAEVTVLSRSTDKAADARELGASDLLVTTDDTQIAAARVASTSSSTSFRPSTTSPLIAMLDLDGTLCVLGNPLLTGPRLLELANGRKKLTSSGTAGLRQTVDLLEFCAAHGITADVETLPSSEVESALNRLADGDVRYRLVLDMSDLDK